MCIHFICTLLFLRTECSIQLWRSKIIFLSDHPFFYGWVGWGFCVHVGFIGRKQFSVTLIEDSVNWWKSWWLMIGGLFEIFFTLERGLIKNERRLNRGRGLHRAKTCKYSCNLLIMDFWFSLQLQIYHTLTATNDKKTICMDMRLNKNGYRVTFHVSLSISCLTLEMIWENRCFNYSSVVRTESTSAESSSFNDNAVALLPLGSWSDDAPPTEFPAEVAPRGRPPLSLSPLLRESADDASWVLLRRLPRLENQEKVTP